MCDAPTTLELGSDDSLAFLCVLPNDLGRGYQLCLAFAAPDPLGSGVCRHVRRDFQLMDKVGNLAPVQLGSNDPLTALCVFLHGSRCGKQFLIAF
jgi:hypothetical protein